jgi:hypothetical protein
MAKKRYAPSTIEWNHVAEVAAPNEDELLVICNGRVRCAAHWGGKFLSLSDRKLTPTHWALMPSVS